MKRYLLKEIAPDEIAFNPHNPRAEGVDEIEADETFEQLKDSVYQFGVLVPVVVHDDPTSGKRYRLVDGERRVRAALATKQTRIPAHVAAKEDQISDLVQAFHIHMLRKHWRPVAQARALKRLKAELKVSGPDQTENELLQEMQERTGCSDTRFKALLRATHFPDSVLDEVDKGTLAWSHLVQIEESFIEPASTTFPGLVKEFGKEEIRRVLVRKARAAVLPDTRTLMHTTATVIQRAQTQEEKTYAEQLLRDFLNNIEMSGDAVVAKYEQRFPESGQDLVESGTVLLERTEELHMLLTRVQAGRLAIAYPELAEKILAALMNVRDSIRRFVSHLNRRR
jgi:ParB/RepB/Spo0J family partition protein